MSKQKRIRLTLKDCQIIYMALRNVDLLPTTKEALKFWDAERLKQYIINNFEELPQELRSGVLDLSRRFGYLSEDDGFYARGSGI